MRILNARVNWFEGAANSPELQVLVDKIPPIGDIEHKVIQTETHGALYYGEEDGYVHYLYELATDPTGFGGSSFTIRVKYDDGHIQERTIVGPWSSRAGVVNWMTPLDVVDVAMTDNKDSFERGYTFMRGAITRNLALQAIYIISHNTGRQHCLEKLYPRDGREYMFVPRMECPKYKYQLTTPESIMVQSYEFAYDMEMQLMWEPSAPKPDQEILTAQAIQKRIDDYFTKYYGVTWKFKLIET